VVDPETGHVHAGHLFVAVLGYSNYTFLELHPDETRASWIQGHQHAFAFFGGVPRIVVPDNPRALIRDRQRDVVLDPTYQEMAAHYHVGVVPARPRHPRDKAKVETGVKIAERAVLGPLETQEVGPLVGWTAAQHYVAMQRDRLNQIPFQKLPGSRWSWFDQDERPRLQPLPAHPFEDGDWRDATVYPHYHIIVDKCYYSVPFHLVGQIVQVRVTANTVEIFADHQRVASHLRAVRPGTYHTVRDHMPPHHQAMAHGWSPEAFLQQARQIGPTWARLFDTLLQRAPVPEQMYPRLRGLVRLHDQFAPTVLEQAAERALTTDITTTRGITAFCRALASSGSPSTDERHPSPPHDNLRGPAYYQQEDDCSVTSPSH